MGVGEFSSWQWLIVVQHEMLLFAAVFFLVGAVDEFAVDLLWLRYKFMERFKPSVTTHVPDFNAPLAGRAAVFVPAWQEAEVIGATISHMLAAWPHRDLRLYVGVYPNDESTIAAAIAAAHGDERLRIVIHDRQGPTTKADCLNRLYLALEQDEIREGRMARMVVLHDAEDMVDPAALSLMDAEIGKADHVQLPVMPLPQSASRWVGSHYCEEFAESHGKAMVVRDKLGAEIPLAGVGCAIARHALNALAFRTKTGQPFAPECLTEDYEIGLMITALGGKGRFIRRRADDGRLIATRAYFPSSLGAAVRQKTRWVHGIAFQSWDRLGWSGDRKRGTLVDMWMRLRDRRGPLAALVLAVSYGLLILSAILMGLSYFGIGAKAELPYSYRLILAVNVVSLGWRIVFRFAFTAYLYGVIEGGRAVLRMPVTNIIAIMAGRRALWAYVKVLSGAPVTWDKTRHDLHPAMESDMHAAIAVPA